jgi:isocitrate/isopropylmalate dehydrogenase
VKICVLPGDGIGVEVIEATLPILQKVQKGFSLEFETYAAGAQHTRHLLPFMAATVAVLLLVTHVPSLTLGVARFLQ